MSKLYKELAAEAVAAGDRNPCSVIAYAVCTGTSYEHALTAMQCAGRPWQQGATDTMLICALGGTGFKVTPVATKRHFVKRGATVTRLAETAEFPWLRAEALSTAARVRNNAPNIELFNRNSVSLLVSFNDHIAAYRGGELHDWSPPNWRKRVEALYLVHRRPI